MTVTSPGVTDTTSWTAVRGRGVHTTSPLPIPHPPPHNMKRLVHSHHERRIHRARTASHRPPGWAGPEAEPALPPCVDPVLSQQHPAHGGQTRDVLIVMIKQALQPLSPQPVLGPPDAHGCSCSSGVEPQLPKHPDLSKLSPAGTVGRAQPLEPWPGVLTWMRWHSRQT